MKKIKRIPAPENWKDLKCHRLATLVPYGAGLETVKLAEHMRADKYDDDEPIVLLDGEILDGRHRHIAAQEADVVPTFAMFIGGDPIRYVRKKLDRQHLNESQRAMLAAALIKAAKDDERANLPSETTKVANSHPTTIQEAADAVKVSRRSVVDAVKVKEEGGEKLNEQVASGETSVSKAAAVARDVFCPGCQRKGVRRNCAQCQELRAKTALANKSHKPKRKKIGAEKFNWKAFDTHYGFVARGVDEIQKAYGGDEHVECVALLTQFRKVFSAWKKRVTAS